VVHDAAAPRAVRAALAATLLAALVAGCGSSAGSPSSLEWQGEPLVVRQPELPRDTIVSGKISNSGSEALRLEAADVRLVTSDGEPVQSSVRFAVGITHQLYPPREGPREAEPEFLQERLGEVANVAPGASTPLVVSWRLEPGQPPPTRVDLGVASLDLP
jgi:hypothetical protein